LQSEVSSERNYRVGFVAVIICWHGAKVVKNVKWYRGR
jgi:hypothetical protein